MIDQFAVYQLGSLVLWHRQKIVDCSKLFRFDGMYSYELLDFD